MKKSKMKKEKKELKKHNSLTTKEQKRKFIHYWLVPLVVLLGLALYNVYISNYNPAILNKYNNKWSKTIINKKYDLLEPKIQFCNQTQIQRGKWIATNESFPTWATDNIISSLGKRKRPRAPDLCDRKYANITYEWQPEQDHHHHHHSTTCEFNEWNETQFCTLLKGAPILMLGDSLTFEHYETLVNEFGVKTSSFLQRVSWKESITIVQSICEHQETHIMYHRLDLLEHNTVERLLKEKLPVVVIMNRGSHYVPDGRMITQLDQTFRFVARWQKQCQQVHGIKCHFFWRTTVPGHPNCGDFHTPVNNLSLVENMVHNEPLAETNHWTDFKRQNHLVSNLLSSYSRTTHHQQQQNNKLDNNTVILETTILDAYYLNILRPDQHRADHDCLHSCIPGKVSVYNRLLLHWLVQSRTMEDVGVLEDFIFPWNRTSNVLSDGMSIVLPDGRQWLE
mmetsp:Transcript_39922/g.40436  ORF Transcript_39922/g.40436 Transcript_39922/m.40436 type:complete len:451 (+) Transcript_39922:97-1449(+)